MPDCPNPECAYCNPPEERCSKCDAVIPRAAHGNLDGGMRIVFEGWYGGTIDPFPHSPVAMLCDKCAKGFLRGDASWLLRVSPELQA